MTAEGHLLFSIACAVFAKNAELTPVLAQGDWWHRPFRNLTCLLPGHRSPKVVSWAAIKMDIKTDRPRFWASWFYPQSAGGICAAGNLLP